MIKYSLEEGILMPACLDKCVVRIRIGRIPPEKKAGMAVRCIIEHTKEKKIQKSDIYRHTQDPTN